MENRKQILETAEALGLDIKKNWKSDKIMQMIEERVSQMNAQLQTPTAETEKKSESKGKVYMGICPITKEKKYA